MFLIKYTEDTCLGTWYHLAHHLESKAETDLAEMSMKQWLEDSPNPSKSSALLEGFHVVIILYTVWKKNNSFIYSQLEAIELHLSKGPIYFIY